MARNGNQETSGKAEFEEDHSVNSLHKLLVVGDVGVGKTFGQFL